jgi:1-acyl-sn-glycerol-3-phosphate acyltransferase
VSGRALVARGSVRRARGRGLRLPLPGPLRALRDEIEDRLARIPTHLNEYGYDPFGLDPEYARSLLLTLGLLYRYWLRVETSGIERVPDGRVLLIGNHGGNTFAYDGAMLASAMFFEHEPPRIVRGMAEYYLPRIPFFNVLMQRLGSVVGTPSNCVQLLEREEAIMVFPEGERGFMKSYAKRYQLQRFGLGFMRLALETRTPIVPVGIVGSEEQSPGLARVGWLGRLIGAPALPITLTFPLLGPLAIVPLPVKFRLHFGEPMHFEGDANEDDAAIEKKVEVVKAAIADGIRAGLATRKGWFS